MDRERQTISLNEKKKVLQGDSKDFGLKGSKSTMEGQLLC